MSNKAFNIIKGVAVISGAAGYAILFTVDWKVALGVFLVHMYTKLDLLVSIHD